MRLFRGAATGFNDYACYTQQNVGRSQFAYKLYTKSDGIGLTHVRGVSNVMLLKGFLGFLVN